MILHFFKDTSAPGLRLDCRISKFLTIISCLMQREEEEDEDTLSNGGVSFVPAASSTGREVVVSR
jgi:hypothetical protein